MRCQWTVRRTMRPTPEGQRRWDRAYQEVLAWTEGPVDRPRQEASQVRVRRWAPELGQVEPLRRDRLEPRQKLEAEQAAEGERHLALAVAVHVLALDRLCCTG